MLSFLYLVSLALTNMGKKNLEEQYLASVTSKADFFGDFLNSHIYYIRTLQLQLFSNSSVEKLSFLGDQVSGYEEIALVNRINEELINVNSSSEFIVNNKILIKSYKRAIPINSSNKGNIQMMWNKLEKLIQQDDEQGLRIYDGKLHLLAMDKNGNKISSIELSKEKLMEDISHIIEEKKDAGVFMVNPAEKYILANDQEDKGFLNDILKYDEQQNTQTPKSFIFKKDKAEYIVTKNEINYLNMDLYTYINKSEVTGGLSKLNRGMLLLTFVLLVVAVLFSWSINRMIHQPLNRLVSLFKAYQESFDVPFKEGANHGEFSYLYSSFDDMAKRLDQSIKENYENELALQRAELKQLQSQINPHFLYNSFYSIYRLGKINEVDKLTILSQKLASYYQFITKSSSDDVPFAKEYKHALDYCSIQQIRFSNRISFEATELTDEMKHILVPRLILQPIIENAFEHAFENSNRGILTIHVKYETSHLIITIEDNGGLADQDLLNLQQKLGAFQQKGEITGMFNVNNRLKIKYGNESGLYASRSQLGGLKIKMIIKTKGDDVNV